MQDSDRDQFQAFAVMMNDAMEQGLLRSFTLVATFETPMGPAVAGLAKSRADCSAAERLEHLNAYTQHVTERMTNHHGQEEQRETRAKPARPGTGAVRYRYADRQNASTVDPAASLEGPRLWSLAVRGKPN